MREVLYQEVCQVMGKARYSRLLYKRLAVIQYVFTQYLYIYDTYPLHHRVSYSVDYKRPSYAYPHNLHLQMRLLSALVR